MRLRLLESSIASRFKVSPKIRTDATFDFYNSICQQETHAPQQLLRKFDGAQRASTFTGPQFNSLFGIFAP
jgi:hypothetical protein